MAKGNGQLVQRLFDRWRERDLEGALALVHRDAVLDWSGSRAPYRGVFSGSDDLRRMWEVVWEAWDEWDPEVVEAIDVDSETVVIATRLRARGKGSGVVVEARGAGAWTFRGGRLIRAKLFQSKEEALRAAAGGGDAGIDVVKRVYELGMRSWGGADPESVATSVRELWDPDLVIEENPAFPDRATYRGYGGLARWWTGFFEVYDDVRFEPREFFPIGDRVVVLVHHTFKSKMGVVHERDLSHLFTVRGGRVVHVTGYMDADQALAAARSSNVDLVRRGFEAFLATGEIRWDTMDPEIEIHDHDIPDAGSYRGHSGFLAWLRDWGEAWDEYAMEAERFVEAGDKVVILLRMKAKGKGSGVEVERADAIVHTVRDGKTIRIDYYNDQGDALRAAGVAE